MSGIEMILPALALLAAAPPPPDARPAGVTVRKSAAGPLYADARGMTLYALNMRLAQSRSGTALNYCIGPCAEIWTPLAAPAGTASSGDWTVLDAAQGPQWAYKGKLVFTFKAEPGAGATAGDGYDDLWSKIAYVPPAPKIVAPANVAPLFVDGGYVLADSRGHTLFTLTAADACGADCARLVPFDAGMAARNLGAWSVTRGGDRAQWAYRGKPVYVGAVEKSIVLPAGGVPLRAETVR